jgi:hypothetical protein
MPEKKSTLEKYQEGRDKARKQMVVHRDTLSTGAYIAEHQLPTGELMNPWNYDKVDRTMGGIVDEMKMIRAGANADRAKAELKLSEETRKRVYDEMQKDTESHSYDWRKRRRPKHGK